MHDGSLVIATVVVVGGRPDGHHTMVGKVIVETLLDQLMGPADKTKFVPLVESEGVLVGEQVPSSSRVDLPILFHFLRIGPQKVCHQSSLRDFYLSVNILDLVCPFQLRRESPMQAQNLPSNDCSQRQATESVSDVLPSTNSSILPLHFLIEAIDSGQRLALVVPPQQVNPVWVLDLVQKQQHHCLHRVVPPIHIVPQEEEGAACDSPADREEFEKVEKLTVNISTDVEWRVEVEEGGLVDEDLEDLEGDGSDFFFREVSS